MKELRVGVIGYGFIGKVHTYGYLTMPLFYSPMPVRVKLVGICDVAEANREAAVRDGGFEFATDDAMELISRDDIDAIKQQARNKARVVLGRADTHMVLEDQRVEERFEDRVEQVADRLIEIGDIW